MNSNKNKSLVKLTPLQYEALKVFQNMARAQQEAFINGRTTEQATPKKTEDKNE